MEDERSVRDVLDLGVGMTEASGGSCWRSLVDSSLSSSSSSSSQPTLGSWSGLWWSDWRRSAAPLGVFMVLLCFLMIVDCDDDDVCILTQV